MRRKESLPRIPVASHGRRDVLLAVDAMLANLPFVLLCGIHDEESAKIMMTLACCERITWQEDVLNWSPGQPLPSNTGEDADPYLLPLIQRFTLFLADIRARLRKPVADAIDGALQTHGVTIPEDHPSDEQLAELREFWRPSWRYILDDFNGEAPRFPKRLPPVELVAHVYLCYDICNPKVFPPKCLAKRRTRKAVSS